MDKLKNIFKNKKKDSLQEILNEAYKTFGNPIFVFNMEIGRAHV